MDHTNANDAATVELLAEMYRNVKMGSDSLAAVVPKIRDKGLMSAVTAQLEQYADFTDRTAKLLKRRAARPQEPSLLKRAVTRGGIMMNTMMDPTPGHIADMIAKGTKTGMRQLEDKLGELEARGCSRDAADLCRDILAFEESASQGDA
jgi:hypothetical protein